MKMTVFRWIAAVLFVCIVGAGANYYMDLGWFGNRNHAQLVMSVTMLLTIGLYLVARRGANRP
jgi:hypothetical protein